MTKKELYQQAALLSAQYDDAFKSGNVAKVEALQEILESLYAQIESLHYGEVQS